ncbi:hypothetical protein [Noviherbaspirillum aridicola]|uniref:Uncharacterized protein n=1 Tax=Noviherbaspirillum aridicola TaxID=2849687 RepID=A0ABQ4PZG1_9BURK|nr:hypothetical protein [Noviherbaspirillum aridicola]GIZ50244.1 hypothetical protein NCCP691_02580 [Noviherbaspirillum aridicola]
MHDIMQRYRIALGLACALVSGAALAKLPALTPEQQQAAEEKKQAAAAQAEREKKELAASMDSVADHWRKRAAENGWQVHPQQPAGGAAAKPQATQTPQMPVRSEKAGTAPPSEDVKNPAEKGK